MVTYVLKSDKYGSLVPDATPIGWDTSSRTLERTSWHSVSVETSHELEFYGDAATYLKRAYESDGIEAEVYLDFYRQDDQDLINVLEYEARINFTEYRRNAQGHVKVSTEQIGFARKIKSADKAKIDLLNTQPLDGDVPLPEMPVRDINLHSKSILKTSEMRHNAEGEEETFKVKIDSFIESPSDPFIHNIIISTKNVLSTEVGDTAGHASQLLVDFGDGTGINNYPEKDKKYAFQFNETGNVTISVDVDFTLKTSIKGQVDYPISIRITRVRNDVIDVMGVDQLAHYIKETDNYTTKQNFTWNIKNKYSINTDVEQGDEYYVYLHRPVKLIKTTVLDDEYIINSWTVSANSITSSPGTTAKGLYFGDAIARTIESLTGEVGSCDNSYYGMVDGYSVQTDTDQLPGKRLLMNGIHVRGWDLSEKPLIVTLDNLLQTAYVLDAVGMGIRKETDGSYKAYLSPVKDFYKDEVVLDLGKVSGLSDAVSLEHTYNKVTTGFIKYDTDSTNSLDEFNTVREWKPSITQHENEYDAISPLRADGYGIETARRQGREVNPNKSTPYDKDSFLVCFRRQTGQLFSEDGSSLTESANLLDPATVYNARLSPQRIRKKHEHLFSGCLQKAPDKKFLFTSGEVNTAMISRLPGEDAAISENAGSVNKNLVKPLFLPETYEFEKVLTSEQVRILTKNPHGTIRFEDEEGRDLYGFLLKAEIDFYNKTAFTLLRKGVDD